MRAGLWMVCLAWGLFVPAIPQAAGFDCAKAGTKVEKMLCADPRLSALDDRLTALFRQDLAVANDKEALRAAQRTWIKTRDACGDAGCLGQVYADRIATLEQGARTAAQKTQAEHRGWALRAAWYERLKWPRTCEQEYKDAFAGQDATPPGGAGENGYGVDIYKLEGDARLAVVQCDLAAYQGTFVILGFEESQDRPGRLLTLTDYERDASGKVSPLEEDASHERAGLPTFDPETGTLTFLDLARGLGDCGSLVTYAFKDGQAVVTEARAQACFDEAKKQSTNPKKWPLVKTP